MSTSGLHNLVTSPFLKSLKISIVLDHLKDNFIMAGFNLENKKFVTTENKSGLSSYETIFHYFQDEKLITCQYSGGAIVQGFIVGKQTGENSIELLFQCLTNTGELKSGRSQGVISENRDGRLELSFDWEWLNGDRSGGKSYYIELSEK